MHWTRRHSRGRPPHPDVLTPAEWRVLELVREGKTNAEIAIDLGVTIPTVKTHVSRIFAKTDTANRAELAMWDGTPSDASRAALSRGFALPFLDWFNVGAAGTAARVTVGAAACVVLVGAVAIMYTVFGSDSIRGGAVASSEPLVGYYMESTSERLWTRGEPNPFIERPQRDATRYWYVDETTWRGESESRAFSPMQASSTISVAQGDDALVYGRLDDTWTLYSQIDIPGDPNRSWIGPATEEDLDALIAFIEAEYDTEVVRAGSGVVLGRDVELIEYVTVTNGDLVSTHRLYIDPGEMLILRQETDHGDNGPSLRFEVTRFDPHVFIERDLLNLAPPSGVTVQRLPGQSEEHPDCSDEVPYVVIGPDAVNEGLLVPDYAPDGSTGFGVSGWATGDDCAVTSAFTGLRPAGDPQDAYILLDQARIPTGIPHWLAQGEPVDVAGHEGYRTTEGDIERLIWEQDGVVAMLEGRDVPFDELLRIAESAYVVTDLSDASTPTPAATPQATAPAP